MVDTLSEAVVSLTAATKFIPKRRQSKRPNVSTLYRWTSIGVRGVVLESLQVGGTRCTSREALQRFFDALTAQSAGQPYAPVVSRNRRRDIERAEKVLDRAGI